MNNIKNIFNKFKKKKKKILISYIVAGYPNIKLTLPLIHSMILNGANIIEIGIPFSDSISEGKIIQKAYKISLNFKINIINIFNIINKFRKINNFTPIILMGYVNTIKCLGILNFINKIKKYNIDGLIIVDYPPEESKKITKILNLYNIYNIFLLSPTSSINRIKKISKISKGFIYYISLNGITGSNNININYVNKRINILKKYIKIPICIGFGITNISIAKKINKICNGIIIGSKIIRNIYYSNKYNYIKNIKILITKFKKI